MSGDGDTHRMCDYILSHHVGDYGVMHLLYDYDRVKAHLMSDYGATLHVNVTISEAEDILAASYYVYRRREDEKEHIAIDRAYHLPEHISRHVDIVSPTLHLPEGRFEASKSGLSARDLNAAGARPSGAPKSALQASPIICFPDALLMSVCLNLEGYVFHTKGRESVRHLRELGMPSCIIQFQLRAASPREEFCGSVQVSPPSVAGFKCAHFTLS